jgi:hypothetical protein
MSVKSNNNPTGLTIDVSRIYSNGGVSNSSDINRNTIMRGLHGVSKVANTSTTIVNSTTQAANNFLESVGIVVCGNMSGDYSLLDAQTDSEAIDNPNISFLANKSKNKADKRIKAIDKFPNADDPFYEPDSNISIVASSEQDMQQKVVDNTKSLKPAIDLISLNEGASPRRKLKQLSVMSK